jgi:hypothetical protein
VVSNSNTYEGLNTATLAIPPDYESLTHSGIKNTKTDGIYQQLNSASMESQQPQHYEALSHTNIYANI